MVDSDGKTHLDKSYCALQKECFGGIVGAKSPYTDDMGSIGKIHLDFFNVLRSGLDDLHKKNPIIFFVRITQSEIA